MTRKLVVMAAAFACLFGFAGAPAIAASPHHVVASRHHAARFYARPRQWAARPYPQQQLIACTVLGCNPVPPGCGSTYGRTMGGTPTGYDVVVCPPGIEPFR